MRVFRWPCHSLTDGTFTFDIQRETQQCNVSRVTCLYVETCDLWDIWSKWWGNIAWPTFWQWFECFQVMTNIVTWQKESDTGQWCFEIYFDMEFVMLISLGFYIAHCWNIHFGLFCDTGRFSKVTLLKVASFQFITSDLWRASVNWVFIRFCRRQKNSDGISAKTKEISQMAQNLGIG